MLVEFLQSFYDGVVRGGLECRVWFDLLLLLGWAWKQFSRERVALSVGAFSYMYISDDEIFNDNYQKGCAPFSSCDCCTARGRRMASLCLEYPQGEQARVREPTRSTVLRQRGTRASAAPRSPEGSLEPAAS